MKPVNANGLLRTSECDELDQFSKAVGWEAEYHQLGKGAYKAWIEYGIHSGIRVTRQYSNRGIAISGIPPRDFLALLLPRNTGRQNICQGHMLEENEVVVMYPDSEATFSASQDFEMFTASFGISQLEDAFRALVHEGLNKFIGKTGEISLPGEIRRQLVQLIQRIINLGKHNPDSPTLQMAIQEAEEEFLHLLSIGVTVLDDVAPGALARRNRSNYLASAREYIEANLRAPMGIATLARETGVSSRTLGYVFREALDTTPMKYIKARRLIAARKELIKANPVESAVTAIANDYGFTHLGYFSRDYKAQFGELPSETLQA